LGAAVKVDDFEFHLDPRRIAQHPLPDRQSSRLMALDRSTRTISHRVFRDLPGLLRPGDLLVQNEVRVFPARVRGRRESGGAVEMLFVERRPEQEGEGGGEVWSCLARAARRIRRGGEIALPGGAAARALDDAGEIRRFAVRSPLAVADWLELHGLVPLPPYIRRRADERRLAADLERYQTVYAAPLAPGEAGAVAAPTAGLHFTAEVHDGLRRRGVEIARLTLYVGPGTFLPVRTTRVEDHRMLPERYTIPPAAALAVGRAKAERRRVVAVGTTTTRALEAASAEGGVRPGSGRTDLFIYPGHVFRAVDAMITNLHLPRSTLIMLVSAFAGRDLILEAYREAIRLDYRFFSYGDAMLIS
jgi:S-adenosylmethionine:tRNA ribosyltransferase-isomerase